MWLVWGGRLPAKHKLALQPSSYFVCPAGLGRGAQLWGLVVCSAVSQVEQCTLHIVLHVAAASAPQPL
jgi:hypothetical protein